MFDINNVLIGADPEVFVKVGTGPNSYYVSGHIFPMGTKQAPKVITTGAVQNDGMALEFNVNPSRTKFEFVDNVVKVFKDLNNMVQTQEPTAILDPVPTVEFGFDYLNAQPEHVRELGCNPDYNSYTMETNPIPNAMLPIRTGSGHVHIGFTEGAKTDDLHHFLTCAELVMQLDYYLGLPSLEWDGDDRRRTLYGKAGAFRPKPYGLEYRVLSNAWLKDEGLMGFVYDRTMMALRDFQNGIDMGDRYGELAQNIIDRNDVNWKENYPELAHLSMN